MTPRGSPDIIGVTATGQSIIASTGCCAQFERQKSALIAMQECWYCKYADFRDNTGAPKNYGICRRSLCKPSTKLSDDDLDAVVGGIAAESGQAEYSCRCGATFCCPMAECPICHSTEIKKTKKRG